LRYHLHVFSHNAHLDRLRTRQGEQYGPRCGWHLIYDPTLKSEIFPVFLSTVTLV
jgi:hypothetical protein